MPSRGAPRKAVSRVVQVTCHMSPREAEVIRAQARLSDRSVSSEVRRALLTYYEVNPVAVGTGRGSETNRAGTRYEQQ